MIKIIMDGSLRGHRPLSGRGSMLAPIKRDEHVCRTIADLALGAEEGIEAGFGGAHTKARVPFGADFLRIQLRQCSRHDSCAVVGSRFASPVRMSEGSCVVVAARSVPTT